MKRQEEEEEEEEEERKNACYCTQRGSQELGASASALCFLSSVPASSLQPERGVISKERVTRVSSFHPGNCHNLLQAFAYIFPPLALSSFYLLLLSVSKKHVPFFFTTCFLF